MRCRTAIDVQAPLERVWEVFTDIARAPERVSAIEGVEILTPGPFGKGFRWRETRVMFGRKATEELEVVSCEPRRSYAVVCDSCHSRWTSTFTFEMQGGGLTRVEQTMRIEPRSLAARLMAPLGRFFMGRLRTHMARDMQELAQRCAAPVAATAAP